MAAGLSKMFRRFSIDTTGPHHKSNKNSLLQQEVVEQIHLLLKVAKSQKVFHFCVDHVISTGRRILKFVVEIFKYHIVFCWIEKKGKSLCKFCNEITKPFLNFECTSECISQHRQFQHSTPCLNDVIHTFGTKIQKKKGAAKSQP